MSTLGLGTLGMAVSGTIFRRLLVNALVDPAEAAAWLPEGVTPHVGSEGVVVGCCLLQIENLRPAQLPAVVGVNVMAAAHRISIDLPGAGGVGVYVPVRHTSSRLAAAVGGRVFPGVHRIATVSVEERGEDLEWTVRPSAAANPRAKLGADFGMRVIVSGNEDPFGAACLDEVGNTCLGATVGLSPKRNGQLEAAVMNIDRMAVRQVELRGLKSSFISSFESAQPATSYLMENVEVEWSFDSSVAVSSTQESSAAA